MKVRFGEFVLDRESRQLFRGKEEVRLQPRTYELLDLLVRSRPRALSKQEIRGQVWPDTVVGDASLTVAVAELRGALGDDAKEPRFVRTVYGFGYAFAGEAAVEGEDVPGRDDGVPMPIAAPTHVFDRSVAGALVAEERARRFRPLLWLGAVVVAIAAGFGGWALERRARPAPAAPITITPFTSDEGPKSSPRLSPDGERVAYAWAASSTRKRDIYVKAVGPGTKPIRITDDPDSPRDESPTWSPDGRQLAFVRMSADAAAIYTIPSLGGQERKLADVAGPTGTGGGEIVPMLHWSPDGEWIALAEKPSVDAPARIVRLSVATGEKRPLTSPPPESMGDLQPQISPDGRLLAFARSGARTWGNQDVWIQPVEGGQARRLTFGNYPYAVALSWTSDGAEILFTTYATVGRVARVPLAGGAPQPVVGLGEGAVEASVRGHLMVYVQDANWVFDVWKLPRPGRSPSVEARPQKLLASAVQASYSPDSRRIAFESARGGVGNIWLSNADGSRPVQLTTSKSGAGTARWSPDGRSIVFDSPEAGNFDVYVVGVDGGRPRRLTHGPSEDGTGTWSRDGRFIYFHSDRSGRPEIWKMPSDGGPAVQVTRGRGLYAVESEDGRDLYYSKDALSGIWRVPIAGGEETELVKGPVGWQDWALTRRGLYYAAVRSGSADGLDFTIRYLDFSSGRTEVLHRKEGVGGNFGYQSLAVSPDEGSILFAEAPVGKPQLMLMENFR